MRRIILFFIITSFVFANIFFIKNLEAKESILATTFPVYLFTKNIVQDRADVTLLVEDLTPDYKLSPKQLEELSQANILVINGLGLETFLQKSLRVAKKELKVIDSSGGEEFWRDPETPPVVVLNKETAANLSRYLGPRPIIPFIYTAPSTALIMVRHITEAMVAIDPDGVDIYRQNGAKLAEELSSLNRGFQAAGKRLWRPKVIVSHNKFKYLARDLGLNIVGTIEEVLGSAPSKIHLEALAQIAQEQQVAAILVDPQSNLETAQALGRTTKRPVALVDLVATGPLDAPLDYYQKVMLTDLEVLIRLFTDSASEAQPEKK